MIRVNKKSLISVMALLICFTLVFTNLSLRAEGEWDNSIYRVYCSEEQLSQEEIDALDTHCCDFVEEWSLDMVMIVVDEESYSDLEESALGFYDNNNYGYGETRDGVLACFDIDTHSFIIRTVGNGDQMISQDFIDKNESYLPTLFENHGAYGVMYGFYLKTQAYMEEQRDGTGESEEATVAGETGESTDETGENTDETGEATDETGTATDGTGENTDETGTTTDDKSLTSSSEYTEEYARDSNGLPIRNTSTDKPSWYPTNVSEFVEYHDSIPSRVVDRADIFTAEEEEAMKKRIAEVAEATGKDIVIVTDNNTYGMERELYCYDFYDFCGYGYGDTYDGMCLFVCMEMNNRGWVASATGVVEDLYTEEFANDMDDVLYEYMSDSKYGEGVLDWIENVNCLYTRGMPFYPDWLPDDPSTFVRSNNADAPRVRDDLNDFNQDNIDTFTGMINEIREKYGIDVVVHSTKSTYGMSDDEYAEKYYIYNGFGVGENYDGIMLLIIDKGSKRAVIKAFGSCEAKLIGTSYDRMYGQAKSDMEGGWYYLGVERFIKNVAHFEKTGRVNYKLSGWLLRIIVAVIAGSIFGSVTLSSAKKKMETVREAFNADNYMNGRGEVFPVCDTFIDRDVTRTKIIRKEYTPSRSYSSSSSSRSTYHSHSTGSSGRSHTSSTRNF